MKTKKLKKLITATLAGAVVGLVVYVAHADCGETASNDNPCDSGCENIYCPTEDILPTPGGCSFFEATKPYYVCSSDESTNSCIPNPPAVPISTRYDTATCACSGFALYASCQVSSYGSWTGPVSSVPYQTGSCPP
jgi:hypothetical protein